MANLGELSSKGIEIGVTATPLRTTDFRWDTRLNFAKNQTRVEKLAPGMDEMTFYNLDGGAVLIKAEEGDVLGNIYTHTRTKDDDGNYIISDDGLYTLSSGTIRKVETFAATVGGVEHDDYKGSLNFLIYYRFGVSLFLRPHVLLRRRNVCDKWPIRQANGEPLHTKSGKGSHQQSRGCTLPRGIL